VAVITALVMTGAAQVNLGSTYILEESGHGRHVKTPVALVLALSAMMFILIKACRGSKCHMCVGNLKNLKVPLHAHKFNYRKTETSTHRLSIRAHAYTW
jgi:hypothetical protein